MATATAARNAVQAATGPVRRPPVSAVLAPTAADRARRATVDQYGELARQVQMFQPVQAKFDQLKAMIKSWFDDAPADAEATLEGKIYLLHVGARERVRRVRDMQKLALAVGHDDLLELLSRHVPLGAVEDLIGKAKTDQLVTEERSGSRRIKAVPKHPSTPARA
jgi:hypothetical protein